MPAFMIAGTASGVGKTTITVGLIAALVRRGLRVQPFKVGPDYIDTSYHTRAAGGVASRNVDPWMVPEPAARRLYARATSGADVAVVEGVMGLFDGRLGEQGQGSSAHVARLLQLPVILVVDAARTARSAAAQVLGFNLFDPALELGGVIVNRLASDRHAKEVTAAIEVEAGVPVLGCIRHDPGLSVPERYLGLIPVTEGKIADDFFEAAERAVSQFVDLQRLLALPDVRMRTESTDAPDLFPAQRVGSVARIAVAQDPAFSFYYQDNLDLLSAWGAELVPFSPLADSSLPPDCGGVYLGGGFPELFAEQLSQNSGMRASLLAAAERGVALYGECGGLMLLGQALIDREGREHPMAEVIPLVSTLSNARPTIGYREIRVVGTNALHSQGAMLRGHEFHWSTLHKSPPRATAAYLIDGSDEQPEGFALANTLASYVHLHFAAAGDARMARRFIANADRAHALRQETSLNAPLPSGSADWN